MKLKWFGVQTNRSRNVKFISPNLKGRRCHVDFVLRKQGMTHLEQLRRRCFLFSRWYFNNSNSFIGYKLVVTRLIWKHPHLTRALVLVITMESRLYFLQKKLPSHWSRAGLHQDHPVVRLFVTMPKMAEYTEKQMLTAS